MADAHELNVAALEPASTSETTSPVGDVMVMCTLSKWRRLTSVSDAETAKR